MTSAGQLRAADSDRERAAKLLRRHHDAGRIDIDELEERLAAAYGARTFGELDALFADLPPLAAAPAPPPPVPGFRSLTPTVPPPVVVNGSGRRGFRWSVRLQAPPEEALEQVEEMLHAQLLDTSFFLVSRHPARVEFASRRLPGWVWPVAIFTFPIGLFAFTVRTEDRLTLEVTPSPDGGSELLAYGIAPKRIRRAVAELQA